MDGLLVLGCAGLFAILYLAENHKTPSINGSKGDQDVVLKFLWLFLFLAFVAFAFLSNQYVCSTTYYSLNTTTVNNLCADTSIYWVGYALGILPILLLCWTIYNLAETFLIKS